MIGPDGLPFTHVSREIQRRREAGTLYEEPPPQVGELSGWGALFVIISMTLPLTVPFWLTPALVSRAWSSASGTVIVLLQAGAILISGTFLFIWRCRKPKGYGIIEIVVGLLIAAFSVNFGGENSDWQQTANRVFTVGGALYIIVRGYDNIQRSLKEMSPSWFVWREVFYGERRELPPTIEAVSNGQ